MLAVGALESRRADALAVEAPAVAGAGGVAALVLAQRTVGALPAGEAVALAARVHAVAAAQHRAHSCEHMTSAGDNNHALSIQYNQCTCTCICRYMYMRVDIHVHIHLHTRNML